MKNSTMKENGKKELLAYLSFVVFFKLLSFGNNVTGSEHYTAFPILSWLVMVYGYSELSIFVFCFLSGVSFLHVKLKLQRA